MGLLLSKARAYLRGGAAALIGILLVAVRFLTASNSRLRQKTEIAEARARHRQNVMKKDVEIDEHEQQVQDDIDNNRIGPDDDINERLWRDRSD